MYEGAPPFLGVRRGRPSYNPAFDDWMAGLPRRRQIMVGARTALFGYMTYLLVQFRILRGNKANLRHAIRHGVPVAIWTPPGEWRVARTLQDLQQIIADGGEVEPPKDAD